MTTSVMVIMSVEITQSVIISLLGTSVTVRKATSPLVKLVSVSLLSLLVLPINKFFLKLSTFDNTAYAL